MTTETQPTTPPLQRYRLVNEGRYARIEGGVLRRYSAPDELTLSPTEYRKLSSIVVPVVGVKTQRPQSAIKPGSSQ